MGVNLIKKSHIIFFVFFLSIVSIALSFFFSRLFQNPPFWVETFTPLMIYGLLYFLFEKWAWSWKVFALMGVVTFPNLNGRWCGEQISSFKKDGKNVVVPAVIEIKQTFSRLIVSAYYERSESHSVVSNFTDLNEQTYLFYTYDNDPNSLKTGTMQTHKGTAKIKFLRREKKMQGMYWNSIGNNGNMNFAFESKELLYRF